MLNLSPLFFTTLEHESCLVTNLDLKATQVDLISRVRTDVRNCLRNGIPRVLRKMGYTDDIPTPRFFTQGSWAYKTLNSPAKHPQQADVDDGCYLPLSFVSQTKKPSKAASVFFRAAEEALTDLVNERNWKLITDKPTCIRIEFSNFAHIDIPLYAIPDSEFQTLAKLAMERFGYASFTEALATVDQDIWTALPKDQVLLAHRECDWKASDPRPVKDWFLNEVDVRGEQLRRIVRYLKALRDWKWGSGGPSSILLMAAAAPLFVKHDRRDDIALLEVLAKLPQRLRAGVNNPVDVSESLTDRLGPEGVEEAALAFGEFEKALRGSVHSSSPSQACSWMCKVFGTRFPNEPDRIVVVTVVSTILATPATPGPSELVGRMKSG